LITCPVVFDSRLEARMNSASAWSAGVIGWRVSER